jgi:hypothetical protein
MERSGVLGCCTSGCAAPYDVGTESERTESQMHRKVTEVRVFVPVCETNYRDLEIGGHYGPWPKDWYDENLGKLMEVPSALLESTDPTGVDLLDLVDGYVYSKYVVRRTYEMPHTSVDEDGNRVERTHFTETVAFTLAPKFDESDVVAPPEMGDMA